MRVGDIVRTPPGGIYGGKPAIVLGTGRVVTVQTGTAELSYYTKDVTPLARIEVTPRGYTTTSGNRFRVCRLHLNGEAQEHHVQVGVRGRGEETRALEIRKLLFQRLVADRVLEPAGDG